MKTPVLIGIAIVILLLVGGGWYVYTNPAIAAKLGLKSALSAQQTSTASTTSNHYHGGFGPNAGGFATGSIETLNGNAFTITLSDGTTKNITITGTTTLENYVTASSTPTMITPADLTVGEQVFVTGEPNSDGSITAARVMTGTLPARPAGGRGFPPHTTGIQNGANGGQVLPTPQPE